MISTWSELEGADGYVVYRFDTEANKYVRITEYPKALNLRMETVTPGTSYKYAVRAYKTCVERQGSVKPFLSKHNIYIKCWSIRGLKEFLIIIFKMLIGNNSR